MNLVFLLGIFFIMGVQPVFMISLLIIVTFLYSLEIYGFLGSYWFSYLLLMVMLSGVLVIFTYMASLIPNESFELSSVIILFLFLMGSMINYMYEFFSDESVLSINLWVSYLGLFSLFLVSFLLSVMLLVVLVSCSSNVTMRV